MARKLSIPVGTTEAQWLAAAKDVLARYDGDAVRLVAQMMVSHELQQSQLAHLHDSIRQLADAHPGLIDITYQDLTGQPLNVN